MMITHLSASPRVLLVSSDSDMRRQVESVLAILEEESHTHGKKEAKWSSRNMSPHSHSLYGVDSFPAGREAVLESLNSDHPFSVMVLDTIEGAEDEVCAMMEGAWAMDPALRVVLCVSAGRSFSIPVSLKRQAGHWVILRKPFFEEDLSLFLSWSEARAVGQHTGIPKDERQNGNAQGSSTVGSHATGRHGKDAALELARDELASSKFFVDNVLRSMADSLFVITMDMSIGAVNPSLLSLLGYREDELLGESPGKIFGEAFTQGSIMETLMMQGVVSGVESSFLSKEGREIPISVSGSLIQDERGQFQGMVCVAQDITDRKRMEEEKRQLHEQLLDTSRQLGMAEVASGVLHNVGNVLNSVNVSVGVIVDLVKQTLAGDVDRISQLLEKHKNDLGSFLSEHPKGKQIPGYLQRLAGQLLDEKRHMLMELERLKDNVGRAQQCVAAQQDLAKPRHITEPFWLSELVEEAIVINQDSIQEERIQVSREFDELPQVVFDRHQILQVVVSLIRNGCQAMDSVSNKRLVLRIKQIVGPPDSVRLEVQDTGIGISSEDLTRIFSQGYSTKSGGGHGTGLHSGALVAKNFGGGLTALSDGRGKGATLVLDLPGQFHFPDL
ncbi:MAG: PAS domain S-box protein [Nitrospirales bacterium]|nr:PAS domain S-box protein [Nitrospirales bacterium]